jgi:hypothetical protein
MYQTTPEDTDVSDRSTNNSNVPTNSGSVQTDVTPPTFTPASSPLGFRIVEIFLRADPFDYAGACPVMITFSGRISVAGGGGTVSYTWIRNDGASAPVETLMFAGPGSQDVTTTWYIGDASMNYSGWQAIEILDPQATTSDRAEFRIQCQ